MFILITTAVAVFVGLFKAAAILLGAVLGVGFFAALVGLLLAMLLKQIIESIMEDWCAKSAK